MLHSLNFIKLLPNVSLLSSTVLSLHAVKVATSFLLSINNLNLPQVLAVPSEDFLENNPPLVLLLCFRLQSIEQTESRLRTELQAGFVAFAKLLKAKMVSLLKDVQVTSISCFKYC